MTNRTWARTAAATLLLVAVLGAFMWTLEPERALAWALAMFCLPAMLGAVLLLRRITGRHARSEVDWGLINRSLVGAGLIVAVSLGLAIASSLSLLGENADEISQRVTGVVMGLLLVVMGNFIPKRLDSMCKTCNPTRVQALQRFTGWTFVLAGLAYIGLWLAAPVDQASLLATFSLAAGVLLVIARTAWVLMTGRIRS